MTAGLYRGSHRAGLWRGGDRVARGGQLGADAETLVVRGLRQLGEELTGLAPARPTGT